jgi:ectoine hydroxylase-related dioxygenase (phytanoyl-CoA dioxygenase family)
VEALGLTIDLGARGGVRDALRLLPTVRALAVSPPMWRLASAVLGPRCAAVRAIIFDKTPGANWKVSWHQDLTITVKRRVDVVGFGSWSEKAGIVHVQPPVSILEQMLTLRLHLDPCGLANGPIRVLPGSHRVGRMSASGIADWRAQHLAHDCIAERGEVVAMRPLLLHASSSAANPEHRRVIHIEYAAAELPSGLEWYEALQPADITNNAA